MSIAGITDRQEELKLLKYDSVAIAGVGGVGTWVAIELTLSGQINRLSLFDADKLESHNLNRLPYRVEDVGKNKAEVCKDFLHYMRGDKLVMAYGRDCTPLLLNMSFPGKLDLLIDCTDRFESQKEISEWAKSKMTKYIRVGVTTNHITVAHSVSDWETGEIQTDRCGVTIPSWISPCVIGASYGVAKALKFTNMSIGGDINSPTVEI